MVLEGTKSSPDRFYDTPPPSEGDAYAGPSSASSGFDLDNIDTSTFPRPILVLGPLFGFSTGISRLKAESAVKHAEQHLKRSVTYDEAHVLTEVVYKLEAMKAGYASAGAAAGVWRWYSTFGKGSFPLFQPAKVDPNKFLFVKGPGAFYARHSARLVAYVFVFSKVGAIVADVFLRPVVLSDHLKDPRMDSFRADMTSIREVSDQRKAGGQPPMRRPERPTPAAVEPSMDDMSPTAGNEPWGASSDSSWGNDSSFASNSDSTQQSPAPAGQQQHQSRQPQQSWSGRTPSPQNDDDASPTGGMFQNEDQARSRPGESAWDRLRRGVASPGGAQRPSPPRREQHDGSNLGDSFTFAESDEERKKAQERAQREFDERLERERQGRDFDEGGKRW